MKTHYLSSAGEIENDEEKVAVFYRAVVSSLPSLQCLV